MADLSCLKHGDIHPELTRYRRGMDFSVSSTKSKGGWNRRQEPFDLNVSVEFLCWLFLAVPHRSLVEFM